VSERSKFNIGDVTSEVSEILDQAKNHWDGLYSGLQTVVDSAKSSVEKTVTDSKEKVSPVIETASSLTQTAKNIGSTALSKLLRKSSDIGDRPSSQE